MNVSAEAFQAIPNTTGVVSGVLNSTLLPRLPYAHLALPSDVVHAKRLRAVYLWVLVGVGFPANVACVVTILSMPMPAYYVALLAVADTVALAVKLLYHQIITHGGLTATSCYFMAFSAFFGCYANWVLTLICLERFIAVCFPFKKQEMFNKRRIVISIVGLGVVLFVIFTPTFFFYEDAAESGKVCVVQESMSGFMNNVWEAGLLSTFYFFLPFILISLFTAVIIRRLQVLRNRRQMSQSSSRSGGRGSEHAVSVMLICASLIFLVLVLPACLFQLFLKRHFDVRDRAVKGQGYLVYQVVTFLSDTTHAINFFVYFLSAAKFRAAFVDRLHFCCPGDARCGRKRSTSCTGSRTIPVTTTMDKNHLKDSDYCDTAM